MPPSSEVGTGSFSYTADPSWAQVPDGWDLVEVAAVTTDSRDRVFVFSRSPHPVIVFDPDGRFLFAWGEGIFARPHGIFVAPDDTVYCTDDLDQTVRQFTAEGRLIRTLGTSGQASDTGATSLDYRTIRRAGPPFHYPTNVALAPSGDLYVSDGYGNARVHRFAPDGRLLRSWGEPGGGPGQFHLPHGIAVSHDDTVFVADRENSRVQLFSPEGDFLDEWNDVARPCQVAVDSDGNVVVAELGFRVGIWPGNPPPPPGATGGRASIFDRGGKLLARWGGGDNPTAPGDFLAPHDVCIDSHGNLYFAEVVRSALRGQLTPGCHTLQKFIRRSAS
jgi:DNA-binding beta-propeller fold protein YncE